jgi:hypothetical protein
VGDGAVGEGAISGEAGRESTANEVDGLRMGKGIEKEEESKEVSKEGLWLHHVSGEAVM